MKIRVVKGAGALLLAVVAAFALFPERQAQAQAGGAYEYAFLATVPSLKSYDMEVRNWSTTSADKDYLAHHTFVIETGPLLNQSDNHVAVLRKLNELGADGWLLIGGPGLTAAGVWSTGAATVFLLVREQ